MGHASEGSMQKKPQLPTVKKSEWQSLPTEMLFTKRNESRALSQVSGSITLGLGA